MKKRSVSYFRYYRITRILICIFVILYTFENYEFLPNISLQLLKSEIISMLWILLSISIIFLLPRLHPASKISQNSNIIFEALISGVAFTGIQFVVGILFGNIAYSPYDLSPVGIITNFFYEIIPVIGRELIRAYLLNAYCMDNNKKAFTLITLMIAIADIGQINVGQLVDMKQCFIFFSETVGPAISISVLLSYFALFGGPKPSLLTACIINGFHWFSPLLPQLNWFITGITGILVPVLETFFFMHKYQIKYEKIKHTYENKKSVLSTLLGFSLSVALIWFVVGVFPVYPSVIATGSMIPVINPGDVILIKKVYSEKDIESLKIGQIITFKRDNIIITHRIKEIVQDEAGNLSFRTKGDNNSVEDKRLVKPNEVKGTLCDIIPKIGYPTLWLKKLDYIPNDVEN